MHVWIDSCVVPHAGGVYIGEDECTGEIDGNIYHLTSPLDGCGTSLAKIGFRMKTHNPLPLWPIVQKNTGARARTCGCARVCARARTRTRKF
ncbi:unnamed protein product [Oikopleura dioica]|uniref:Uncharacterized protein n=1 Tax=Oikopleura dioica TaxID=34765 RepID=E4Y343_OIKDI|nr:unnamed protein product [Oikopleura dioica]